MDADVVWDTVRGWRPGHPCYTERGGLMPWYSYSAAQLADRAGPWWGDPPEPAWKQKRGQHRGKYGWCSICGKPLSARSPLDQQAHFQCLYSDGHAPGRGNGGHHAD